MYDYSRQTGNSKKKVAKKASRKSFTLAEVLITLGIIGVVAGLTIPNLVNNKAKQETVAKLEKSYTTLAQAVKLSENDNGPNSTWDWGSTMGGTLTCGQTFNTYFAPYLKVIKYCSNYSDCGYNAYLPWKWIDGNTQWSVPVTASKYASVILSDGSLLMVRCDGSGTLKPDAAIDINGSKGPNILGKDLFRFVIVSPQGFMPVYYTGINPSSNDCINKTTGDACAEKIIMDGWQIKDDYPW